MVTSAPLARPAATAGGEAGEDREPGRQVRVHRELPHHHRAQHHDGSDREVDAGGEHDQGLRHAENGDDRDLLQDQRKVERLDEARAGDRAEAEHGEHQHQGRDRRRMRVQRVAQARQGAALAFLAARERCVSRLRFALRHRVRFRCAGLDHRTIRPPTRRGAHHDR